MKDSTRKRLEAIIAMVGGPIEDPDWMNMEPEQHLNDLRQIHTICKNALHEDPVARAMGKLTTHIDFSFSRLDYEHTKSQEGLKDQLWEQIGKLVSETNELGYWDRVTVTSRILFSPTKVKEEAED